MPSLSTNISSPSRLHSSVSPYLLALFLLPGLALTSAGQDIPIGDTQLFSRLDSNGDGSLTTGEIASDHKRLFERLLRQGDKNDDQALSLVEWQQAMEPGRPPKPMEEHQSADLPGAQASRLLLLKLDTDGDAVLTAKETPDALREVFQEIVNKFDKNGDKKINRSELNQGGPQIARQAQQWARRNDIDVEKELHQMVRRQGAAAKRFDVDPKRPMPAKRPQVKKPNGKKPGEKGAKGGQPKLGQILGNPKRAEAMFDRLDKNNDGHIAKEEVPKRIQERFGKFFRQADRNQDQRVSKQEFLAASKQISRKKPNANGRKKGAPAKGDEAKNRKVPKKT